MKENIVFLIEQEAQRLTSVAKAELDKLENETTKELDLVLERKRSMEVKRSAEEMMRRMKTKKREGVELKEYEVGAGDLQFWERRGRPGEGKRDREGDVEMGGTEKTKRRSAPQIRRDLNFALQELIGTGVWYLNGYDTHTGGIKQEYEQALRRAVDRAGSGMEAPPRPQVITSGIQAPATAPSILKSKADAGLRCADGVRRSDTGSPASADANRTYESIEKVARRTSSTNARGVRFSDDVQSNSPSTPERKESTSAVSASNVNAPWTGPIRTSPPTMDSSAPRPVYTTYEYNQSKIFPGFSKILLFFSRSIPLAIFQARSVTLKTVTCWWWNQGKCRKSAEQCTFRHGPSPYGVAPEPGKRW